jgi:predicted Zn finger-like uncharacterized protein
MLIVCPNCATSYDLTAAALGEGRSVRCTRCRTVWFATAQEPSWKWPKHRKLRLRRK